MPNAKIETLNPESLGDLGLPYSQGVVAGGLCYVAGQVALDAEGNVIAPGDAGAQTTATLERVEAVLAAAGASLEDIVSANVFLTDDADAAAFNAAWAEKFGDHMPTRAAVRAGLLLDGLVVEIQAIAILPA